MKGILAVTVATVFLSTTVAARPRPGQSNSGGEGHIGFDCPFPSDKDKLPVFSLGERGSAQGPEASEEAICSDSGRGRKGSLGSISHQGACRRAEDDHALFLSKVARCPA